MVKMFRLRNRRTGEEHIVAAPRLIDAYVSIGWRPSPITESEELSAKSPDKVKDPATEWADRLGID